jgi:hypothetical protein
MAGQIHARSTAARPSPRDRLEDNSARDRLKFTNNLWRCVCRYG